MAARTFEDSTGAVWEVFEVHRASNNPVAVSAGLEQGWLAFVNGPTKRRLAPFPSGWEAATPMELERLCAGARLVSQPRIAGRETRTRLRPRKADQAGAAESPALTTGAAPHAASGQDRLAIPEARLESLVGGEDTSVEGTVRAFAHQARRLGLPAIEAMVRLKALLLKDFPAPDSEARDMRRVRRWFVETYYFERNA
jgi:hypothetical protein